MYLIQAKSNRFLKTSANNSVAFTTNETLADVFNSEREATDYIRKHFKKKERKNYKPKKYYNSNVSDLSPLEKESRKDGFNNCVTALNSALDTYLAPEIEYYAAELKKYDGMILDIRHYLRNEKTKLNACQACKVSLKLQQIERDRAVCRKELQRLAILRSTVTKSIVKSIDFDYDEYKNREIENVAEFLFGK